MAVHNGHVRFPGCHAIPDSIKFFDLAFEIKIEPVHGLISRGQDHRVISIEIHGLIGIDMETLDQCPLNLKNRDVRGEGHPFFREPLSCQVEILKGAQLTTHKE